MLRFLTFVNLLKAVNNERYPERFLSFNLRDGVVEWDHGAGDHSDVHHVPVVPHVGPWVENEASVENLRNVIRCNTMYQFLMMKL